MLGGFQMTQNIINDMLQIEIRSFLIYNHHETSRLSRRLYKTDYR